MTPIAEFEPELVDALNMLIEDERASVEMEVALTSGATEYAERDALSHMGMDDIRSCETLRAEMEDAGLLVSPQINGVVFEVLGAERYDDRLRSFAHHQRIVAERAEDLLESNLDGVLRDTLASIVANHARHIEWATQRADDFAATRLLEFAPRASGLVSAEPANSTPGMRTGAQPALPDIPTQIEPDEAATTEAEAPTSGDEDASQPDASGETVEEEALGVFPVDFTPEPVAPPSPKKQASRARSVKPAGAKATPAAPKRTRTARSAAPDETAPPAPRASRARKTPKPTELTE